MRYILRSATFIGLIVACFVIYVVLDAGRIARFLADRILANAVRPIGLEVPPTAYAIPFSSSDVQVIGGRGEGVGCSIPGYVHWLIFSGVGKKGPIELEMRQACVAHDYCYRHGAATYGYTQADCDFLLQEQAFRLCSFIENEIATKDTKKTSATANEANKSDCRSSARVVTLGVRVAGSDSFRHLSVEPTDFEDGSLRAKLFGAKAKSFDTEGSTYFEFDPYPTKSNSHVVYRLADAPSGGNSEQKRKKALYAFEVRPSGMTVHVVTWTNGQPHDEALHELRGQQLVLTRAPLVVRSGTGEDWFVWWQRYNFASTGARLVALAPGRATQSDWDAIDALFPRIKAPSDCQGIPQTTDAGPVASAIFYVGVGTPDSTDFKHGSCDDANISDVYPAPELSPSGFKLRLMALSVHPCTPKDQALCFTDMILDPSKGGGAQLQVPDRALDYFGRREDRHRYRNFVTAPLPFGSAEVPALAWFRRDDDGSGRYDTNASMRRLTVKNRGDRANETGLSLGTLKLLDFSEDDEPAIITGRTSGPTRLMSVRLAKKSLFAVLGERRSSIVRQWTWPEAQKDAGEKDIEPDKSPLCEKSFEASWQARPMLAVGDPDGTLLIASRVSLAPDNQASDEPALRIATMRLGKDGRCGEMVARQKIPLRLLVNTESTDLRDMVWSMRSKPILVGDIDGDGRLDLVIPNSKPEQSRVVFDAFAPRGKTEGDAH